MLAEFLDAVNFVFPIHIGINRKMKNQEVLCHCVPYTHRDKPEDVVDNGAIFDVFPIHIGINLDTANTSR